MFVSLTTCLRYRVDKIVYIGGGELLRIFISLRRPGVKTLPSSKKNQTISTKSVSAVVLAAGGASRYGELKQLLDWKGQPFVRVVAETAIEAGLSPVIVVTGAQQEKVRQAVEDLPVEIVFNPDWKDGQSTSMRIGLQTVPLHSSANIFLLADQPQIPVQLLCTLVDVHTRTDYPVVAPQVGESFTNPVLFARRIFPLLERITGDKGGRAIFERHPPHLIPWPEASISLDVDTPKDYQDLLRYNEDD